MHAMRCGSIALGLATLLAMPAVQALAAPRTASAEGDAPVPMVDFAAPLEVLTPPQGPVAQAPQTFDFSRVDFGEMEFRSGIWSGELMQMQRAYRAATLHGFEGAAATGSASPRGAYPFSLGAMEPNFTAPFWLFQSQLTRQFAHPLLVRRDNELFRRPEYRSAAPGQRSGAASRRYPCNPGIRLAALRRASASGSGELHGTARIGRFFASIGDGFHQFTSFIWRLLRRISGAPREISNC